MTEFERAFRDADRVWGEHTVSPRVERTLRRALREGRPSSGTRSRRWAVGVAFALAAALVWILVGAPDDPAQPTPMAWGDFQAVGDCPGFVAHMHDARVVASAGRCVLREPGAGMVLEVESPVAFHRIDHGVALERGTITFDVEPRSERRRVQVSGGMIEILGTRFTVVEEGDRGWVRLDHGSIRFVAADGVAVMLAPGDELRWPLPDDADGFVGPESTPGPEPSEGAPEFPTDAAAPAAAPTPTSSAPSAGVRASIRAQVEKLRAQGRFAEAAELLRKLDAVAGSERERLSYERGALLTYRLGDRAAACAHWQGHRAQFPRGDYAVEVRAAMASLGCAAD